MENVPIQTQCATNLLCALTNRGIQASHSPDITVDDLIVLVPSTPPPWAAASSCPPSASWTSWTRPRRSAQGSRT